MSTLSATGPTLPTKISESYHEYIGSSVVVVVVDVSVGFCSGQKSNRSAQQSNIHSQLSSQLHFASSTKTPQRFWHESIVIGPSVVGLPLVVVVAVVAVVTVVALVVVVVDSDGSKSSGASVVVL